MIFCESISSRASLSAKKQLTRLLFLRYERGMRTRGFVIAKRFRSELNYTLKSIIIELNGIFIPYMV